MFCDTLYRARLSLPYECGGPEGPPPLLVEVVGEAKEVEPMIRIRAGALVVAIGAALALGLLVPRGRAGAASRSLPAMPAVTRDDRVLVVAPHCDDETLGTGGVLRAAVRAGAKVRVAVITNGDGFHLGAQRLFRETVVAPGDYVRMGLERQRETRAALSDLGVPRAAASFLGYPDAGTATMWMRYWDPRQPYRSPQTLHDRSPYGNAFTHSAPYAGRSLLDDLKKIIAEFKPTVVYCPHPNDVHQDHWAAYGYTAAALYELGMLDSVRVRLCLIHRRGWPTPRALARRLPLLPPPELATLNTYWSALPLDAATEDAKYHALLQHRSQLLVMSEFILSFARTNELLGEVPWVSLPVIPPGAWGKLRPAILDPPKRSEATPLSADLTRISAATDGAKLYLRIELAGPPSPDVTYRILLHPLSARQVGPPRTYTLPSDSAPGVQWRIAGMSLDVTLPISVADAPGGVMLAVETAKNKRRLDQSAWALLRIQRAR